MDARTFFFSLATGALPLALIYQAMEIISLKRPVPENVEDVYNRRIYRRWQKCRVQCCLFRSVRILYDYLVVLLPVCTDFGNIIAPEPQASLLVKIGKALAITVVVAVFPSLFSLGEPILRKKFELTSFNVKSGVKTGCFIAVYVFSMGLLNQLISWETGATPLSPSESAHRWMTTLKWVYTGIAAFFLIRGLFRRIRLRRALQEICPKMQKRIDWLIRASGVENLQVLCNKYDGRKMNAYLLDFPGRPTVILNKTLLEKLDSDEVCAVVLHEIGHLVHGGLKQTAVNYAVDGGFFLLGWIFFEDFFKMIKSIPNPMTGWLIVTLILLARPAYCIIWNVIWRRQELDADAYAAENGFGGPLISSLKIMEKRAYSAPNPLPLLWLLQEDHPTLSKRIKHIEACMNEKEEKELACNAS